MAPAHNSQQETPLPSTDFLCLTPPWAQLRRLSSSNGTDAAECTSVYLMFSYLFFAICLVQVNSMVQIDNLFQHCWCLFALHTQIGAQKNQFFRSEHSWTEPRVDEGYKGFPYYLKQWMIFLVLIFKPRTKANAHLRGCGHCSTKTTSRPWETD